MVSERINGGERINGTTSESTLAVRDAARGFLISRRAASRYSHRYLEGLQQSLALLSLYTEDHEWPGVAQITASHLEEYLTYLQERPRWFGENEREPKPLSQSTIWTHYVRLKVFWNWLKERGHVEVNPLDLIPRPKVEEKTINTVSEREMANLLELTAPIHGRTKGEKFRAVRNQALLYLLIDTPARRSEVFNLTLADIDLDAGAIRVMGKGGKERWMPLGAQALEALWAYMQARAPLAGKREELWVEEHGRPVERNWIHNTIKRLGRRAGVSRLHIHRFRHTYATSALREGMPERVLRIVGGWRRVPDTYFRTLGLEDAMRFHRQVSPGDRVGRKTGFGRRARRVSRGSRDEL